MAARKNYDILKNMIFCTIIKVMYNFIDQNTHTTSVIHQACLKNGKYCLQNILYVISI